MGPTPGERALVITSPAAELRRGIGVTAWAVLEELVLNAQPTAHGGLSSQASARVLAQRVGIGKDTAAKALRRLDACGLARRDDHRDPATGVFAHSVYALDRARLAEAGIKVWAAVEAHPLRRGRIPSTRERGREAQRSLFEPAPALQP